MVGGNEGANRKSRLVGNTILILLLGDSFFKNSIFQDRVSLCNGPGTHCLQAGLKFRVPPASVSKRLGLKAYTICESPVRLS